MSEHIYIHGDLENLNSLKYYCSPCNEFFPVDHFNQENHPNYGRYHNYDIYQRRIEWRNHWLAKKHPKMVVDSSVRNIFVHLTKPKLLPFYVWLLKQKHRADPVGWYARESECTCDYPVHDPIEGYEDSVVNHLRKRRWMIDDGYDEAEIGMFQALDEFALLNKKKSAARYIPLKLRYKIFKRDNYSCCICGVSQVDDDAKIEVDHKIAVANGGTNDIDNLWTLCFPCNRGKGAEDL